MFFMTILAYSIGPFSFIGYLKCDSRRKIQQALAVLWLIKCFLRSCCSMWWMITFKPWDNISLCLIFCMCFCTYSFHCLTARPSVCSAHSKDAMAHNRVQCLFYSPLFVQSIFSSELVHSASSYLVYLMMLNIGARS